MNSKKKAEIRKALSKRNGWKCAYCETNLIPDDEREKYTYPVIGGVSARTGYDFPELDHIVPVKSGGSDNLDNLALCCHSCNSSKNNRTPEEWKK